jgi:hypothetical protein
MARSKEAMEELLKALNENANEVGLGITQEKTKYDYLEINLKSSNINRDINVKMGPLYFERVQTFIFLGSIVKDKNKKAMKF